MIQGVVEYFVDWCVVEDYVQYAINFPHTSVEFRIFSKIVQPQPEIHRSQLIEFDAACMGFEVAMGPEEFRDSLCLPRTFSIVSEHVPGEPFGHQFLRQFNRIIALNQKSGSHWLEYGQPDRNLRRVVPNVFAGL